MVVVVGRALDGEDEQYIGVWPRPYQTPQASAILVVHLLLGDATHQSQDQAARPGEIEGLAEQNPSTDGGASFRFGFLAGFAATTSSTGSASCGTSSKWVIRSSGSASSGTSLRQGE